MSNRLGKKVATFALVVTLGGASGAGASYLMSQTSTSNNQVITTTTATPTSSSSTDDATSIASKISASVVAIKTEAISTDYTWYGSQQVKSGAGSGVIYTSNGYIVTCAHVVDGASKITVTTADNKTYTAKLVGSDTSNDTAVLKIEATGLTAATFADSSKIVQGSSVYAVGNPEGEFSNSITSGIISATSRSISISLDDSSSNSNNYNNYFNQQSNVITLDVIQTDAAVSPGNSGGGLFDSNGNFIGMVNAKSVSSGSEGLGFAIPSNKVKSVIESITK